MKPVQVLLWLLWLVGCGDDTQSRSGESSASGTQPVDSQPLEVATVEQPTWAEHVAPLLFDRCAACHRPGEAAPFSLLSYDDAVDHADQIVTVTESGYMPPWLPDPEHDWFRDARVLTVDQRLMLRRWVRQGAVAGDRTLAPPVPEFSDGWQLGVPDLILEMPEEYLLGAEGGDLYRNFAVPTSVRRTRFVRGLEFQPGNRRVVHHASIMIDRSRGSRRLQAESTEPGFPGIDIGSAENPDGQLLGWTPGQMPSFLPDGMAWRLEPRVDLIFQMHFFPSGKEEAVRARVGLFFTEERPNKTPVLLRLGSRTLDIAAGDAAYHMTDAMQLPVDTQLLRVYPHAHYLCKQMRVHLVRPDGSRRPLISISDWDFNWQDDYEFLEPVELGRGSTLHMEYVYDNSAANVRNPFDPPQRVRYGGKTLDEMGDLWLQLLPKNPGDLALLRREVLKKVLLEQLAERLFSLERSPDSARHHHDAALAYAMVADRGNAVKHYRKALELDESFLEARINLGITEGEAGNYDEAEALLEAARAQDPTRADVHSNLGLVYLNRQQWEQAAAAFETAIEHDSLLIDAYLNLASARSRQGDSGKQLEALEQAVQVEPFSFNANFLLASAAREAEDHPRALKHFRKAVRIDAGHAATHAGLGRTYLELDDSQKAVTHMRKALQLRALPALALDLAVVLATDPKVKDLEQAQRWQQQAQTVLRDPLQPRFDYTSAEILQAQGKAATALTLAQKALAAAAAAGDTALQARVQAFLDRH